MWGFGGGWMLAFCSRPKPLVMKNLTPYLHLTLGREGRVATLHASCTLHISRFGRVHRFSNFVPSSAHGSRSGHELGTDDVGGHAEFKSVFQSAYALLHEVGKTAGTLVQRRTLVPTMGCNGLVMVSGQAALRTSTPLVPHVVETTKERAMVHL